MSPDSLGSPPQLRSFQALTSVFAACLRVFKIISAVLMAVPEGGRQLSCRDAVQ